MGLPNLQSFKYIGGDRTDLQIWKYDVSGLEKLARVVTLSLTAKLTDDSIQLLISKCKCLQNLAPISCLALSQLNVFSYKLKSLKLADCYHLDEIVIGTPNLLYLDYLGYEVVEISRMNTHSKLVAKLEFELWREHRNGDKLDVEYDKLKKFLERFNHVKTVSLVSSRDAVRMLIPEDMLQNCFPPLYHLKDLSLEAASTSKGYKRVLTIMLSLSVHLEVLTVRINQLITNMKFRPVISMIEDDYLREDWSDLPLDHLRSRLVGVEIKNMKGNSQEEKLVEFLRQGTEISTSARYDQSNNWIWKA